MNYENRNSEFLARFPDGYGFGFVAIEQRGKAILGDSFNIPTVNAPLEVLRVKLINSSTLTRGIAELWSQTPRLVAGPFFCHVDYVYDTEPKAWNKIAEAYGVALSRRKSDREIIEREIVRIESIIAAAKATGEVT